MHIPVLLKETIDLLAPFDGAQVLDCTFGGGGHTRALLDSCDCFVFGIDRDPEASRRAEELKEQYKNRFDFRTMKFSEVETLNRKFDRVLFDLGVSSFQLDEANRGFSFQQDARLDMRMSSGGISAYDVINSFSEYELIDIIWSYGNERRAQKIGAEIIKCRKRKPIETTFQLADIVRKAVGIPYKQKKYSKIDSATKTFQAIRMYVNDELNEIFNALESLPFILNDHARIAIISFHALEDKLVKNWFNSEKELFLPINEDIIKPGRREILHNKRSRSAVLRGFEYIGLGESELLNE